jgi:DNA-binding NarL/FixJ family response regulator
VGPPRDHDHASLDARRVDRIRAPPGQEGDIATTTEARSAPAIEDLRVLIVDDHDLFRTGLRNLLEEQGVQIIGEAASGAEALRLVRELAPDVVVMDLNMPGMTGVEATRQIATVAPLTRVVVLTISDQDGDVMDAILAGACGYLLKHASIQELMSGIRSASVGESLISPTIAAKVLQRVRASSSQPDIEATIRAELSDREIEVLKLIANGKDNAMIANELHISPKTVKNHISNILMKLQIDNRIQAAVYAVRSGIV